MAVTHSKNVGCAASWPDAMSDSIVECTLVQAAAKSGRYPIDVFLADIAGIEATTEPVEVKRKSRD